MPNLSSQEKDDLILAYLDNELDNQTSLEIKEYIENNKEAKEKYEKLRETKSYFIKAYAPFKNIKMKSDTEAMIKNYPLKEKVFFFNRLSNFWKKPISKLTLAPAFVAGFLGFAALNIIPQMNVAIFHNADLKSSQDNRNELEKVLNQETMSVSKKLDDLESILNKKFTTTSNNMTMKGPNPAFNKITYEDVTIIVKEIPEKDCISLEVLSDEKSTIKLICKTEDNNWQFKD